MYATVLLVGVAHALLALREIPELPVTERFLAPEAAVGQDGTSVRTIEWAILASNEVDLGFVIASESAIEFGQLTKAGVGRVTSFMDPIHDWLDPGVRSGQRGFRSR